MIRNLRYERRDRLEAVTTVSEDLDWGGGMGEVASYQPDILWGQK